MIRLNYRDSKPIYEQIEEAFKKLIISGALKKDERLPSVRALATQLSINPNTIQRAYNELENDGYLYSLKGKGNFVSGLKDNSSEKIEILIGEIAERMKEAEFLGMSFDELILRVKEAMG
ncbi:MAG: GntR family transcriptional regulator [Lachnospiraceae bacterium]|nr:GntR family transcriptional regulator [Lachnospiraceae bacterium]